MTSPGGSLGALFVDVRPGTSRFEPELSKGVTSAGNKAADNAGPGMGRRLAGHIGKAIALGTGVLAVGLTKGLAGAVKQASDLNETVSRSNVVFGKNAGEIQRWAKNAATSMGQSTKAAIDGATTFAIYGKAAGKSGQDLVGFSTGLSGLASDMASFSNTSPEEAIEAIGAAMRGESDPIEKYGVLLNETVLKTRALKMGIIETTKQALTPQQRVLAVQAELFAQLGNKGSKTLGDFERTQAGLANQTRISKAVFTDFSAEIGTAFLPIVTRMVTTFNTQVMPALQALWREHGPAVVAWAQTAATRFDTWASSIDKADVQGWLDKAREAFNKASPVVSEFFTKFQSGGKESLSDTIKVTGVAVGFLADHADDLGKALPYVVAALGLYKVAQLGANLAAIAAPFATAALAASNWRLAASNTALAASTTAAAATTGTATVATGANTVAENTSTISKIRGTATTVAQRVATVASAAATWLATAATTAMGVAIRFAMGPIGLIITGIALLAAGVIYAYKHNETFRKIVDAVWKAIKIAVKAVGDWFVNTLWPSLKRAIDQLGAAWTWVKDKAVSSWNWVKDKVSAGWEFIRDKVFNPLKTFITKTIPAAFKTGVDGIKNMWDKAKEAAATPIRFVIDTVFNGIGGAFNKVADFLKLPASLRVPPLKAGFASGGQLPGPASDVDNMLAVGPGGRAIALAGGEYVVNARQTAKHLPILKAINEGTEGYADGGLVGFLKNPVGWFKDRVSGPIGKIKDMLGSGSLGSMATGLATRLRDGVLEKAKSFFGGLTGGGGPGNGTGILKGLTAQMVVAAKTVMSATGMNLTSGLRPGAITVTGNRSYHGAGRAGDFSPPSMRAFNIMRGLFSYARELIYSPAGGRQIHNGRPHMYTGAVRRTHFDHIHLALAKGGRAYDRGGAWPTGTMGVNTSGHTEHVLTGGPGGDIAELITLMQAMLTTLQGMGGDVAAALNSNTRKAFQVGRSRGAATIGAVS